MPMTDLTIAVHLGIAPLVKLQGTGSYESLHKPTLDEDEESYSCLIRMALDNNDINMIQTLFVGGMKLRPDCGCTRTLSKAVQLQDCALAQILLDHGADPDDSTSSPLLFACRNGHEEMVKTLLDGGANVNFVDSNGENPLEAAARRNHLRIVQLLLDHGIYFRLYGIKALWFAAQNGFGEIVRVLLEKGLSPNISPSPEQGSPLGVALRNGRRDIVRILLSHDANVFESDVEVATSWGDEELTLLLLDRMSPCY